MTRNRLAIAILSTVLIAARAGLARRPGGTNRPGAIGSDPSEPPAAAADGGASAPVDANRAAAGAPPRPLAYLASGLPVLGTVGLLLTAAFVVMNARGYPSWLAAAGEWNLAFVSVLVTLSIWAIYLMWRVPQWQASARGRETGADPRELFDMENAARGTLGQILSGVAVLAGLLFAWQQFSNTGETLQVSQEGQITERFTRAVDQLSRDDLTVRLGGIYALERIARDSARDHGPVMEVLSAFVRQNAPRRVDQAVGPGTPAAALAGTAPDVQAVLKVIGRRENVPPGLPCVDLSGTSLVGANFIGANLENTCFGGADLRGANFDGATMPGVRLQSANLTRADLGGADMRRADLSNATLANANLSGTDLTDATLKAANLGGAILDQTILSRAVLSDASFSQAILLGATLREADLANADLTGATLSGVDLEGALHLTPEQVDSALVDANTKLPTDIRVTPDF